ncbi:MAG: hypothetical protein ACLQIQ_15740 [Beijerinckiaceae bacterium]
MIEQAMIFALGFLLAGLVALALAPAVWQRAIRLTRRRLEAQVPVSIEEILAERDQLRAQNAVECRRLEDRAAALNRLHAADLSELGRRAAIIAALEADWAVLVQERAAPMAENKRLERELAETRAEVAAADKALFDAEAIYKRQRDEIQDRNEAISSLAALAEVRLASLTASENYTKGLQRHLAALRTELANRQRQSGEKANERNQLADLFVIARSDLAKVQKKPDVEAACVADLEASLSAVRAGRTADAALVRGLDLEVETGDTALQGALDAELRRCEELESELAMLRRVDAASPPAAVESAENALLRQSISEIGAAMIRLAQTASEPVPPAACEMPKTETNGAAGLWIVANGELPHEIGLAPRPSPAEEIITTGEGRDDTETPLDIRSQA